MNASAIKALIDLRYPNNSTGLITPTGERETLKAIVDFVNSQLGIIDVERVINPGTLILNSPTSGTLSGAEWGTDSGEFSYSGPVTLTANHATLERIDLIVGMSGDTVQVVTGTASENPVFPPIPMGGVLLQTILRKAGSGSVVNPSTAQSLAYSTKFKAGGMGEYALIWETDIDANQSYLFQLWYLAFTSDYFDENGQRPMNGVLKVAFAAKPSAAELDLTKCSMTTSDKYGEAGDFILQDEGSGKVRLYIKKTAWNQYAQFQYSGRFSTVTPGMLVNGSSYAAIPASAIRKESIPEESTADFSGRKFYKNAKDITYTRGAKDIIINDGGDIIVTPSSMGNLVFTKPFNLRGVVDALGDKEFTIENSSGEPGTIQANYVGGPANSAFNIPETITVQNGEKLAFKSEDGKWVVSQNTGEVAWSDRLDAVGARFTVDPDGLQLISNVQNRYTGHPENFKEVQFTPTIVDGNIFKQIGSKYLKRVFTTPIDLESVGIRYNDETYGASNYEKIIVLLNLNQPVCIKDRLYITPGNSSVTSDKILIYGDNDNSEMVTTSGYLMSIKDQIDSFILQNFKITVDGTGVFFLFQKSNIDFVAKEVSLKNIIGEGNITIRMSGTASGLGKIDYSEVSGCRFSNNNNSFYQLIDVGYDLVKLVNNEVRNFYHHFFYNSTNSSNALLNSKKLIVDNNLVVNDFSTYRSDPSGGAYYCFILTQCFEAVYTNNHVEGIKSVVTCTIYDAYFSCRKVTYKNNVYKNNISFDAETVTPQRALFKGKGTRYSDVQNNDFIIEKTYLEDFIEAHPEYDLQLENCFVCYASFSTPHPKPGEFIFKNNTVKVYRLHNNNVNSDNFKRHIVDNNTFEADIIEGDFIGISNYYEDVPSDYLRTYSFSGNKVNSPSFNGAMVRSSSSSLIILPSKSSLTIKNNEIKGILFYQLFSFSTDFLEISDNKFWLAPGFVSNFLCDSIRVNENFTGKNNTIYSPRDTEFQRRFNVKDQDFSYDVFAIGTPTSSGPLVHPKDFNYFVERHYTIKSPTHGEVDFSYSVYHEYEEAVGEEEPKYYLNYIDFTTGQSHRIEITSPLVFGNSSTSNHIVFEIKGPKTNSTIGHIRLRRAAISGDVPIIEMYIPNGEVIQVKATTNVYR